MSQCVRCSKPCNVLSQLCTACQAVLQYQIFGDSHMHIDGLDKGDEEELQPLQAAIVESTNSPKDEDVAPQRDHFFPQPYVTPVFAQDTSSKTRDSAPGLSDNSAQVVHNLNKAAHLLATGSDTTLRVPRPSRLTPYQKAGDVPLSSSPYSTEPLPATDEGSDLSGKAELRFLSATSESKVDKDIWEDVGDPLQARRFPTPSEIKRIEEEDMRQAIEAGHVAPALSLHTIPFIPARSRVQKAFNRRTILLSLFVLAILALIFDSALVSLAFFRNPNTARSLSNKPPSVTVSKSDVHYGENIIVSIHNFSAFAHVVLTRDIEEPLFNQTKPELIQVKSDGSADIIVTVLNSWGSGFHTIEAEDTITRYTATASLHIDTGPTQPAHLGLSATDIDLGEDIQGANTIQSLALKNQGDGNITWSATSDQPWLSLSPNNGIFSDSQNILLGATRANLDPGDYTATITISSNVDQRQAITVQMKVGALPPNPGPVESVSPAVLAFNATDGGANPATQALAINNPGSQPLYWSIGSNQISTATSTKQLPSTLSPFDAGSNWLNTGISSGIVLPGKTSTIYVSVRSQNFLPGVYTRKLLFQTQQGYKALNNPLEIDATLTIEPRCSLMLAPTDLAFTAVSGQNNPATQSLNMVTSRSCGDSTPWNATSSASWLSLLPTHGVVYSSSSSALTVSINTAGLKPGPYTDAIMVAVPGQSSASVLVNLTVQPPPAPNAPIIGAAPLSLTFSATAGQLDPPGQTVTITNTGLSALTWNTAVNSSASSWLNALPASGKLLPGQTQQLLVKVSATHLTSGLYAGKVALNGLDSRNNLASGSPQTIAVNFSVLPPCSVTPPSSTQLAFTAIQGESSPSPQTLVFSASGSCSWPLRWKAMVDNAPPWLNVTPTAGRFRNTGQSVALSVTTNIAGIQAGSYQATVTLGVTDSTGQNLPGLVQSFSVTLVVAPPCALQVSATAFNFSLSEGSISNAQNIPITTTGSCGYPVNWTATVDGKSASWLNLSAPSGVETDGGSTVSVTADATHLASGTYNGIVTLTASDSSGTILQGSPVSIPVTITVTGFTLSGTVTACTDVTCVTPIALAGGAIAVKDSTSNAVVASTTADAAGNYSIPNLPAGSYTISATGTDAQGMNYSGSSTLTLSSDKSLNIITALVAPIVPTVVTPIPTPTP